MGACLLCGGVGELGVQVGVRVCEALEVVLQTLSQGRVRLREFEVELAVHLCEVLVLIVHRRADVA